MQLDPDWLGDDYAVPTAAGDDAMRWAATTGGWVLDRTYTGKGLAGLLGNAADGRWARGADVIFVHTGGMPAVFAPGGDPLTPAIRFCLLHTARRCVWSRQFGGV